MAIDVNSLSPAMFLTKICIVSSASAEEARDEALEIEVTLLERMVAVAEKEGVVLVVWLMVLMGVRVLEDRYERGRRSRSR